MAQAFVALGSNLGDRQALMHEALVAISKVVGLTIHRVSSFYETAPITPPGCSAEVADQPDYLNAVASVLTDLSPADLLARLQTIEDELGRERNECWGARTMDLDLILYDEEVLDSPDLIIPHPRMHEREFVLQPLVEIAPYIVHPILGKTPGQMLAALE
jgi:2-amino-4-hydroxy-6-hydroxymethyldihydropteridine diphosphokinase